MTVITLSAPYLKSILDVSALTTTVASTPLNLGSLPIRLSLQVDADSADSNPFGVDVTVYGTLDNVSALDSANVHWEVLATASLDGTTSYLYENPTPTFAYLKVGLAVTSGSTDAQVICHTKL